MILDEARVAFVASGDPATVIVVAFIVPVTLILPLTFAYPFIVTPFTPLTSVPTLITS